MSIRGRSEVVLQSICAELSAAIGGRIRAFTSAFVRWSQRWRSLTYAAAIGITSPNGAG